MASHTWSPQVADTCHYLLGPVTTFQMKRDKVAFRPAHWHWAEELTKQRGFWKETLSWARRCRGSRDGPPGAEAGPRTGTQTDPTGGAQAGPRRTGLSWGRTNGLGSHFLGHTATPTTETQTRTCMGTFCKECWDSRTSHSSGLEWRALSNHMAAPLVPLCEQAASADTRQKHQKQPPALREPTSDSIPSAWFRVSLAAPLASGGRDPLGTTG